MSHAIERYPLIPLRDIVIFPDIITPLAVGRDRSIVSLEHAYEDNIPVALFAQKDEGLEDPKQFDLYEVGTLAHIKQVLKLPDNSVKTIVEGSQRCRLIDFDEDTYTVAVELLEPESWEWVEDDVEVLQQHDVWRNLLLGEFEKFVNMSEELTSDVYNTARSIDNPGRLADYVTAQMGISVEFRQEVLGVVDIEARVEKVLAFLQQESDWVQVERRIRDNVRAQVNDEQRRYFQRQKLEAIQKEIGHLDGDDGADEMQQLLKKIEAKKLPKAVHDKTMEEFGKLKNMPGMSPEASVLRHFIDWVLDLPWHERSRLNRDLGKAEKILDADHYGLEKVKERILEHLAVQMRVRKGQSTVLCLVGPPGVGKTSLGMSIAQAMGRKFVRVSLGGVRDEAEIRGHRRTYIGSMPGRIIKAMKRAGVVNPLIMLDEIDKMGMDYRGDPASALLEVLDKEQNSTFNDHYMELDYDLSDVMFLTTANTLEMPAPLVDRLEVIELAGYSEEEKLNIAKQYLIPKVRTQTGVKTKEMSWDDAAILDMIRYYTREAGVRQLEREIAKVHRKFVKHSFEEPDIADSVQIDVHQLAKYLGVRRFEYEKIRQEGEVGLVRGLAWTRVGGDMLTIEAATMSGKQKLQYTGSLGEVMQESIQAAFTVVRRCAERMQIDNSYFEKHDFHVHVPEGATPKDGPSAGITMVTALISAITDIPVRADVAMTGEITLRGEVLPIGGLKEKLLAAVRGGMKVVLIPQGNAKDLADIPQHVIRGLSVLPVSHIDEVLEHALVSPAFVLPMVATRQGDSTDSGFKKPGANIIQQKQ